MTPLDLLDQTVRPHVLDGRGNEKPITWKLIKEYANKMTEDQLDEPVIIWGDEKSGGVFAISQVAGDLINPSGEGLERMESYSLSDDEEDKEMLNEPVVFKKGCTILEGDL